MKKNSLQNRLDMAERKVDNHGLLGMHYTLSALHTQKKKANVILITCSQIQQ